jgi:NNP family nitrate/nitrite transporter-like MFS transporter
MIDDERRTPTRLPLSRHARRLSWLYLGTFGSFIGYSAALPLLMLWLFPGVSALAYVWLGPLVGALVRPLGSWLADIAGGARVALWVFVVMLAATCGVLHLVHAAASDSVFHGLLAAFMVLFTAAGIGNGAIFSLISRVFEGSGQSAAAALALASAVGGYGGFFIPLGYGTAIAATGTPAAALWVFLVFYGTCIAVASGYIKPDRRAMHHGYEPTNASVNEPGGSQR